MSRDSHDAPCHTEEECARLLERFLLQPTELLAALAPRGWSNSPLVRCYHPTPEQRRQETAAFRENLRCWSRMWATRGGAVGGGEGEHSADDDVIDEDTRPVDPEQEVVDLVGHVLWDVLSDNHSVFDGDGNYDLGSFRASAGFLADEVNVRYRQLGRRRGYMDFYMGTVWISHRADLGPVYRWTFAGLRAAGCDWRYAFPRIYLVSLGHELEPAEPLWHEPSAAVAAELEAAERERERSEVQNRLDSGYNEAVERARRRPPPVIVQAYNQVYGGWPRGWPPSRTDE